MVKLKGKLAEFKTALQEEIKAVEAKGQSSLSLFHGERIASNGADFRYRFHVDKLPVIPADTPCKLDFGGKKYDVSVVKADEDEIVLISNVPLPEVIQQAKLETGTTVLMERLIQCIEENAEKDNKVGNRMLPPDDKETQSQIIFEYDDILTEKSNTQQQTKAILSALTRDITYIWGPPGTGKTSVICQIIMELNRHDRSVLIVSHTNIAVDGAIDKVDSKYFSKHGSREKEYPILRLGTPAKLSEEAISRVSMDAHTKILGEELQTEKAALEEYQRIVSKRLADVSSILAKNTWKENSQLAIINTAIIEIDQMENQQAAYEQKKRQLINTIGAEKEAHPEADQYPALERAYREKKTEYDSILKRLERLQQEKIGLSSSVIAATDEWKKHNVYASLKQQEESMMSEQFLQGEISKANQKIDELQKAIELLSKEKAGHQHTIDDFEKKSGFGKLFVKKADIIHAQSQIEQIQKKMRSFNEEKQRQERLKQEYEKDLEKLLVLKERIKNVIPTYTKEHWENEITKRNNKLAETEKAIPKSQSLVDKASSELAQIISDASVAKKAYMPIHEMEIQRDALQVSMDRLYKVIAEKMDENARRIEDEKKLCAVFYYTDQTESKALLQALSDLMHNVEKELAECDIPALEKEKEQKETELADIVDKLNEVSRKLSEIERQVILDARIIGATLAKSYISDTLRSRTFDTVILDEASMAPIPALWCVSYLAEKNIVIVGDFLQLPPIVVADETMEMAQKWLAKDIFYHSGMQDKLKANPKNPPDCFVMLNDQFRMEKEIADIANIYYGEYCGLRTPPDTDRRKEEREAFYSWYTGKQTKHCIHLIDTSAAKAWVTGIPQGKSHSRMNSLSAIIDVDLAFMCLENKLANCEDTEEQEALVLIVAPYKPQIKRINELIEIEYRKRGFIRNLGLIKAGTIHSFQGNEAEIVIFDLVIDEPHWKANLFMSGDDINDDLKKMFNVAVTRAKFKLFMVGNFPYCMKNAKGNALSELLNQLMNINKLKPVSVFQLFSDKIVSSDLKRDSFIEKTPSHMVCSDGFTNFLEMDLQLFQQQCIIYSPSLEEASIDNLMPSFLLCQEMGKKILLITEPSKKNSYFEKLLIDIGFEIIHKKGMHEKLIFFDDDIVWTCTESPLSALDGKKYMMHRHQDRSLADEYRKVFCIRNITNAVDNGYELSCPICKQELLIRESDSGGIYWECINKDYSRNGDQPYPRDGIYRCKCGAQYLFSMKKQPRWVCSENSNHYQLIRLSDLRLEKMAALIPETSLGSVKDYLEKKQK